MPDAAPQQTAVVHLRAAAPVFLVADVNATAAWYAEHLGFETAGIFPARGPASWASLQRDAVEILIGWNRYVVRGAEEILRGELPFYDLDPGPDYSKVNAVLIREYADTNREALLERLTATTGELTAFLRSMDRDAWDVDFGVRHGDETLTVKSTVADLIADYQHHRTQLDAFRVRWKPQAGAAQRRRSTDERPDGRT